jgi:TolB-like protein
MKRSMLFLAALAPAMAFMPSVAAAPAPGAPVVAILAFDNNSIGKDAKDFDGIGKGVMDLLITDLASSTKVRVVDRERVQQILAEQNLTKSGAIDAETAVRVGKLLGACYSIYGGFMRDMQGGNVLTAHTTSNETGQIENPEKVLSKGDDVMALIAQLSAKLSSDLKLSSCGGGVSRGASAGPAQTPAQQGATSMPMAKDAPAMAKPTTTSATETFAKPLSADEVKQLHKETKVDARTMLLYSRALDAIDRNDKAKATELLRQVVAKAPAPFPASEKLAALTKAGT